VITFCRQHNIPQSYLPTLEAALRKHVVNPTPLFLQMGVVTPTGDREILGIPEGTNSSIETGPLLPLLAPPHLLDLTSPVDDPSPPSLPLYQGVFCIRYGIEDEGECEKLQERVAGRISGQDGRYLRRILASLNVDAPDGRKLTVSAAMASLLFPC
jgi:hypothetical protein